VRRFGCKVFVKVDDAGRKSLDPKARDGIYVGNDDTSMTYRVMLQGPSRLVFVDTIHCTFDEASMATLPPKAQAKTRQPTRQVQAQADNGASPDSSAAPDNAVLGGIDPLLTDFDAEDAAVNGIFGPAGELGGPPQTYRQAMSGPDADRWRDAVRTEIESLVSNETFAYADAAETQSEGRKLLTSRWIFTTKPDGEGGIRYKARLVARGDRQREGIDYSEVYSPVVNSQTLRTLFAVAAINDYEVEQMDAVTAFLNAPLDEELYMRIPDGFEQRDNTVLRLKRSLYGLKQAPRSWNTMLHDWLLTQDLQQSKVDPCLYFIPGRLWLAFWVDDFLIVGASPDITSTFKAAISARFKMRDMGPAKHFLGMEISRDRSNRTITLSSRSHIDELLERFGMADCKSAATPLPSKSALVECTKEDDRLPDSVPYRAVVGSLLYVATWTRPDIAFAVSQIARFQSCPSVDHWQAAKHIMRYLQGTRSMGLTLGSGAQHSTGAPLSAALKGFVDASWGEDPGTRRSQSAYIFTLGLGAISWRTKLQQTVALSSTEAEYLSLSDAVKDALFLRNLLADLCPSVLAHGVVLFEDNQSTIKQSLNTESSARTKHIDIRHHFFKQHVSNGDVTLEYIPTEDQVADALTKNLDRVKVSRFRQIMLGGCE
jgi:hypothetical protein